MDFILKQDCPYSTTLHSQAKGRGLTTCYKAALTLFELQLNFLVGAAASDDVYKLYIAIIFTNKKTGKKPVQSAATCTGCQKYSLKKKSVSQIKANNDSSSSLELDDMVEIKTTL